MREGQQAGRTGERDRREGASDEEQEAEAQGSMQSMTQGRPTALSRDVAHALVIKDGDLFFLGQPGGQVPLGDVHGFGLYYHDCRYLQSYQLKLGGHTPAVAFASAASGFMAVHRLTNPDIATDGSRISHTDLGITRTQVIDAARLTLHDRITIQNFGVEPVEFPLELTFQTAFDDIFLVRGAISRESERLGGMSSSGREDDALRFVYDGADGLYRGLTIHFAPIPDTADGSTACFWLRLEPGAQQEVTVSLSVAESEVRDDVQPKSHRRPDLQRVERQINRSVGEWLHDQTEVQSVGGSLDRVVDRALRDLRMLRTDRHGHAYYAAGVPWFVALYGRDSLITALQTLSINPGIAAETLRLLASLQGEREDAWRDEQPGKIPHELRVGELTRTHQLPYTPYYGTVDATLLFLILLGRHAAWTGDLGLFHDLRPHVGRALDWIDRYGDQNGDGYTDYETSSEQGLVNQGWKDSADAIVNKDGSLAAPPITLVEVQGYVYLAKVTVADLFVRVGEQERGERLRCEAEELRERFNRDFWLADEQFYALALQAGGKPVTVISSNPGEALWTGIVEPGKAARVIERLMADDMFGGWGIRTLSNQERRYNPLGYHLGTVWPHDNALIAAGFRRYGHDDDALRIASGLIDAASHFDEARLPELFGGFARERHAVPMRYPVASRPQAWAAGSIPSLLETVLGLTPEAFERRLRIVRPMLPAETDEVELRGLRVADAQVDLRFVRTPGGTVAKVLDRAGDLDVVMEL